MKLNLRETLILGFGLIFAVGVAMYLLVIEPMQIKRDKNRQLAARLQTDLAEMKSLAAQYKSVAEGRIRMQNQVEARGSDFSPFSYLENLARETGLTGQIESMTPVMVLADEGKPQTDQFDVRLAGIGLLELVRFLYKIESSDMAFFVENLNIKPRYLSPRLLDVTLRLSSPKAS